MQGRSITTQDSHAIAANVTMLTPKTAKSEGVANFGGKPCQKALIKPLTGR